MNIIHDYGAISKEHKRRKSEDFLSTTIMMMPWRCRIALQLHLNKWNPFVTDEFSFETLILPKRLSVLYTKCIQFLSCLIFFKVDGTYFLPYEFRAVEIDKPRGQEQVAEKSRPTQIFYVIMHGIKNKEYDEKALGSHPKTEQDIVQVTPPSCSPNKFEEVCLSSNLLAFIFGHNFIVDASIRKKS